MAGETLGVVGSTGNRAGVGFGGIQGERDGSAGPGAGAGVDFFVADSVSLGLRGTVDLFITLNPTSVLFSVGGGLNATTYF